MILFLLFIARLENGGAACDSGCSAAGLLLALGMLLINTAHDIEQSLIINWQNTVSVIDQHVEGEHRVVRTRDHIVVVRGEHAGREAEYARVAVGQVLQDESTEAGASATSDRMKKEEPL